MNHNNPQPSPSPGLMSLDNQPMEQPLDIEITGDFDGFYKFLLDIEQLPRITRLTDLEVVRSDKVDGEMKTKLVLSVYYEGDGSESK
jgi:Tfp pilus assembly protein PilO